MRVLKTLSRRSRFMSALLTSFLSMIRPVPLDLFFTEVEPLSKAASKEMRSSYAEFAIEEEEQSVTEAVARILNENLSKVTLSQISSREQFYLADIVECVASVEKHVLWMIMLLGIYSSFGSTFCEKIRLWTSESTSPGERLSGHSTATAKISSLTSSRDLTMAKCYGSMPEKAACSCG